MGADRSERTLKKGIDASDCRKNRQTQKIELRKAKKEEGLQKRRNMEVPEAPDSPAAADAPAKATLSENAATALGFVARNGAPEEFEAALAATRALRKQLSLAKNPPIDETIEAGLVPAFVTMLQHPDTQLQFEAAWCLTNIASGTGEQCETVVSNNGVPGLVALISSPSMEVCEQAVWAIGNIAGDCPRLRDLVLVNGATELIIKLIEATANMGQIGPLRNAVWALSNLVRGKPQPSAKFVHLAVPVLSHLLSIDDEEVRTDTCWALSYVTDGGDDRIDAVCAAGAVAKLMLVLHGADKRAHVPALRALCNVLTGSAEATQAVLDAGILEVLPRSLKSPKAQTRKEAVWALSNIAAGTPAQVEAVVRSPLLAAVIHALETDEFDVKKEAAWVVANVLYGFKHEPTAANASRAQALVQLGALRPIVALLECHDAAVQKLMLEAASTLLAAGEAVGRANGKGDNPFLVPFDEAEGVDKLEALQEHNNEEIYDQAVELLEKYFGEDGDEDENLLPNVAANANSFAFGAPALSNAFGNAAQPAFAF